MTTFIEAPTPTEIAACIAAGLLVATLKLLFDRQLALAESTRMAWLRIPLAVPLSLFSATPLLISLTGGHLSEALEKSSPDIVSRVNLMAKKAMEDPVMGWVGLILVLIYLILDLLPAIDRILNGSQYHRMLAEKRAADEMERRKRQWIERIEDV